MADQYTTMQPADLQALCTERDLDPAGGAADLRYRLRQWDKKQTADAGPPPGPEDPLDLLTGDPPDPDEQPPAEPVVQAAASPVTDPPPAVARANGQQPELPPGNLFIREYPLVSAPDSATHETLCARVRSEAINAGYRVLGSGHRIEARHTGGKRLERYGIHVRQQR